MKLTTGIPERFFAKVNKTQNCWEWTASLTQCGYGMFGLTDRHGKLAHRVSWILHFGEITSKQHVLHKCDNPKCVNPAHLFLGDQASNMRDRAEKFRSDRTKVTKEQVQEIRKSSLSQAQLAKKFGMTRQGIWRIIHRKSYFWLE